MAEKIMRAENFSVGYGQKIIVKNINFELRRGEILTLIGANGSGKSTVLKSILRQLKTISGTVFIGGRCMDDMKNADIAKNISAVMTEKIDPELMTCGEVVESGRYPYTGRLGILSHDDRRKADEAMALVGVDFLRYTDFSRISDGQRQRVMLARAICQEPEIMILDEPTSFLDIQHKIALLNILKKLVMEKNIAVVMSLHELDLAQKISDRIMCINNGTAEKIGTPQEIFSGDYISSLYGMESNFFNQSYCSVELERPNGSPKVFVIAGGSGCIPIYRHLQRRGIAFATGVVHRNSIEFPCAVALASEIVTEKPFEAISETAFKKADEIMRRCSAVVTGCESFGSMNRKNAVLLENSRKIGIFRDFKDIQKM